MISTLHKYLTKDLIKTGLLAAAGFTLVMTVFAIIEPMRKRGLGASEVLRLFWYLLPVMMSLTLPVAALLAATMVYGRFSMDNELTACRASGVSVYTLLKPGLAMGLLLALLTLVLSNWVAPAMLRRGEEVGEANLQRLVFQNLRRKGHVKFRGRGGSRILYADQADPNSGILRGVVAISLSDPGNAEYMVAGAARAKFTTANGATEVTFPLENVRIGRQRGSWVFTTDRWGFGPYPVPRLLQENPSFYDWQTLSAIRQDPMASALVRQKLEDIRRDLRVADLYDEVAAAINSRKSFEFVRVEGDPSSRDDPDEDHDVRYVFSAPLAAKEKGKLLLSGGPAAEKSDRPVTYIKHYYRAGKRVRSERECARAEIDASYVSDEGGQYTISIRLEGVRKPSSRQPAEASKASGPDRIKGQAEVLGPLRPGRRLGKPQDVTLERLYNSPERFPGVATGLRGLRTFIKRLHLKILAEMHGRIAYGLGCFLLVATGAALGLVFRGGHILSAFVLSCIPAMALVVLLISGKQLVANPDTSAALGVMTIWSGVAILAATVTYLYGVVLRR